MAADDAILDSVAAGHSGPTLRLYAWSPPCLSLGYAQSVEEVDRARLRARGWDLVRRPTGGRAILHADEITYAVVARASDASMAGGVLESYLRLSHALEAALGELGVASLSRGNGGSGRALAANPICFENPGPSELLARGRKLIGSAQFRRKGAVLQHGSLPLRGDLARICQVLRFPGEGERAAAAHALHQKAATLEEVTGSPVSWEAAAQAMAQGFERGLGVKLEMAPLMESESAAAESRRRERYAARNWTERV